MKTFELEGKGREIVARSADQKRALKAMRKNNEIPAVLYGCLLYTSDAADE